MSRWGVGDKTRQRSRIRMQLRRAHHFRAACYVGTMETRRNAELFDFDDSRPPPSRSSSVTSETITAFALWRSHGTKNVAATAERAQMALTNGLRNLQAEVAHEQRSESAWSISECGLKPQCFLLPWVFGQRYSRCRSEAPRCRGLATALHNSGNYRTNPNTKWIRFCVLRGRCFSVVKKSRCSVR